MTTLEHRSWPHIGCSGSGDLNCGRLRNRSNLGIRQCQSLVPGLEGYSKKYQASIEHVYKNNPAEGNSALMRCQKVETSILVFL